ncbi:MAG: 50S ribosome-binding GTPase [Propionicimonas sp.]|uniref:GTPase n=1 Tax=Propionicimonas sp. TaxID=1955623 RepID=UPI003D115031
MSAADDRLAARVRALAAAVEAAEGRSDAAVSADARAVVERAGERVAFSGSYTVVALAGATGSGKSSLFNAVTGTELARVAVRRPTTAKPMAVSWGSELPHALLDWLDVTGRHLVPSGPHELSDLVLLDLPDHDSTEVSHRLTVDRLVELVDALIWVVDPQKYADAALHEGYLKRLAPYADVMMVVLNQADRLTPEELDRCLGDLRRLLDAEGLRATPIMAVSALRGTGIKELREALARTVANKQAMTRRLSADVTVAATALAADLGTANVPRVDERLQRQVVAGLGAAAGVPIAVDGVRRAWRKRGTVATGWPFVTWLARLRPDPLKRLRLDLTPGDHSPTEVNRTSLPKASAVQRARADQGLRELTDAATSGLPRGWASAVRNAAGDRRAVLLDRLDVAIAGTDLEVRRGTWWWGLFGVLQWLLIAAVVVGAVWLLANPLLLGLGLPQLPPVLWYGVPAGTWLLVGGVLAGLLLGVLGRALVEIGANAHARDARRSLEDAVRAVVTEEVFEPVEAELARYRLARQQVAEAART